MPWGRNFDEYRRMFHLTNSEIHLRILGCGDGPASFNAECNQRGGHVTSVDPLYQFSRAVIKQRINETYEEVMKQTSANQHRYIWDVIPSLETLGRIRMQAMRCFLASYEDGKIHGRYIPGELPHLPFAAQTFDLALCAHFLFLYTDNLTFEFHVSGIREMLRVAREVRIFPLVDVNAQESSYLNDVLEALQNYKLEIQIVNYEFQRGGNRMLRIRND